MASTTSLLTIICLVLCSTLTHCTPITSPQRDVQENAHLPSGIPLLATYPEPRGTRSHISAPSTGPSLPAQSSSASSPSYGLIVITGISFLCFNGIISVFLIWARQLRRSKKAAVGTSLELPAGTYPSELKEDGVHEMYDAPPELQEDALHEMPVQPPEMMGDMWPELAGGPAQVSVSGNSSGQGCLDIEDQEIENDETRPVSKKSIHGQ